MKIVFSPQHDNRVTQVYITLQHVYQFIFHNYGMSYPQWHLLTTFFTQHWLHVVTVLVLFHTKLSQVHQFIFRNYGMSNPQ
jgi:hypothetical protein